jgi:hypothetical protein
MMDWTCMSPLTASIEPPDPASLPETRRPWYRRPWLLVGGWVFGVIALLLCIWATTASDMIVG